jgi:hypothetical protein
MTNKIEELQVNINSNTSRGNICYLLGNLDNNPPPNKLVIIINGASGFKTPLNLMEQKLEEVKQVLNANKTKYKQSVEKLTNQQIILKAKKFTRKPKKTLANT